MIAGEVTSRYSRRRQASSSCAGKPCRTSTELTNWLVSRTTRSIGRLGFSYRSNCLRYILFDLFGRYVWHLTPDRIQDLKTRFAFSDETPVDLDWDDGRHRPTRALNDDGLAAIVYLAEQLRKSATCISGTNSFDHSNTPTNFVPSIAQKRHNVNYVHSTTNSNAFVLACERMWIDAIRKSDV